MQDATLLSPRCANGLRPFFKRDQHLKYASPAADFFLCLSADSDQPRPTRCVLHIGDNVTSCSERTTKWQLTCEPDTQFQLQLHFRSFLFVRQGTAMVLEFCCVRDKTCAVHFVVTLKACLGRDNKRCVGSDTDV